MPTITDIKHPDEWNFYWFKNTYPKYHGIVYKKCAIAKEPLNYSMHHGILLIADDLTMIMAPDNCSRFTIVGNLKRIPIDDIGVITWG